MYDNTVLMLTSDYSLGSEKSPLTIGGMLGGKYKTCSSGRRASEWQSADVMSLVSGTSMAHLYARGKSDWSGNSFFEDLENDGLVDALQNGGGVDLMAGRSREGGIVVLGENNRVHIREDIDGRITYIAKDGDPFGLSNVQQVMDAEAALSVTADSRYPDGILQMLQLFRSRRAGDLVLSAAEGASFSQGDGVTHGSLHRDHIMVPFMSSVPIGTQLLRSVDVFALILEVLGIEPAHALDGQLPLSPEAVSEGSAVGD
jgi:hypothetical protein